MNTSGISPSDPSFPLASSPTFGRLRTSLYPFPSSFTSLHSVWKDGVNNQGNPWQSEGRGCSWTLPTWIVPHRMGIIPPLKAIKMLSPLGQGFRLVAGGRTPGCPKTAHSGTFLYTLFEAVGPGILQVWSQTPKCCPCLLCQGVTAKSYQALLPSRKKGTHLQKEKLECSKAGCIHYHLERREPMASGDGENAYKPLDALGTFISLCLGLTLPTGTPFCSWGEGGQHTCKCSSGKRG